MSEQDPHPSDAFPKAPTVAEWERMTPAERQHVIDTLPNEVTEAETHRRVRGLLGLENPIDDLQNVIRAMHLEVEAQSARADRAERRVTELEAEMARLRASHHRG